MLKLSMMGGIQICFVVLVTIFAEAECGRNRRQQPTIVNAREGEMAKIKCPREQTNRFVNWYKNGRQLSEIGDIRFKVDELRIANVRLDDKGRYSCGEVDGHAGELPWKNFTLFVYRQNVSVFPPDPVLESVTDTPAAAPTFVEYPPGEQQMEVDVGSSPKLRCRVIANPRAQIQWFKDGQYLRHVREDVEVEGYSIKFNSVQTSDKGRYMCKVSNSIGSVNFTYTLVVTDPNVPTARVVPPYPLNTSVTYGSAASLQCKVRSNSIPTIMWLKQVPKKMKGTMNLQNKIYLMIKNETMSVKTKEGVYLNQLVIPEVRMEDRGVYVCLGLNQGGGSDIREAYLTVIQPPAMVTSTQYPTLSDNSWEYIFGSPSATLAVLIAIPVVIILIVTIAIIYALNKRKKNTTSIRRPPNSMISDHEVSVPLNMNANNGCHPGQYVNGMNNGSYNKTSLSNGDHRYKDKLYHPPSYRSGTPQQYSQYFQSDGSYRSSLHYPPPVPAMHPQHPNFALDIADSDSHFSSVSHTRPQYMSSSRNPYDDRDIHSDPPGSRIGGHHCPPPPPSSYYSGQW